MTGHQKSLTEWLRDNQATKDRKWIYTLVAWYIEHQDVERDKINRHINIIYLHNQGYFEKYKEANIVKWREYNKERYAQNPQSYKDASDKADRRMRTVYKLYQNDKLPAKCTKIIAAQLETAEALLKIKGKCKWRWYYEYETIFW